MCVAVPGKVIEIDKGSGERLMGKVDFSGIIKDICLAYVPDIKVGDYVMAHVGFALSRVDEAEALDVFATLDEIRGLESP
jgi:hydrogenase expression/formation protein HypC